MLQCGMEFRRGGNVEPLHAPSPPMSQEGVHEDVKRLEGEVAEIQGKVETWKGELSTYIQSEPSPRSVAAIAKRVEAENLLKETEVIEEEVYILLDEIDVARRASGNWTSKLPTRAEWSSFLNRKSVAIDPLIAKIEDPERGGRLQKWREMRDR